MTKTARGILIWLFCPVLFGQIALHARVLHAELIFNISATGNADADAGFQEAAQFWSSQLTDDITVDITAGFNPLGAGVLGQASSTQFLLSYSEFRSLSVADQTSTSDTTFVNALSTGTTASAYVNLTTNSNARHQVNADSVLATRANLLALGVPESQLGNNSDAEISFNSTFNFDFDRSDGITPGAFDFVGVAIHEIGHALGFISFADITDQIVISDDDVAPTPLDFTRFSPESLLSGSIDVTADERDKFFSIDGGLTAAAPGMDHWSTGVFFGDGQQASHWRDDLDIGIMDPTLAPGEFADVTPFDLLSFDVIGWDLAAVPEPSSSILALTIPLLLISRRRRFM